jgi:hypothetical protein
MVGDAIRVDGGEQHHYETRGSLQAPAATARTVLERAATRCARVVRRVSTTIARL